MKIYSTDNKEIDIEDSCETECPNCGVDYLDMFYIPNWMVHRCEECLENEARKYNYKIVN